MRSRNILILILAMCLLIVTSVSAYSQSNPKPQQQVTPPAPPAVVAKESANRQPRLSNFSRFPNTVAPTKGNSGDVFEFGIEYVDFDNDPCDPCEIWIDLDKNGAYEDDEKFSMVLVDFLKNPIPVETVEDREAVVWSSWKKFYFTMQVFNDSFESDITYKFVFSDGDLPASGRRFVAEQTFSVVAGFVPMLYSAQEEVLRGGVFEITYALFAPYLEIDDIVVDWKGVFDAIPYLELLQSKQRKIIASDSHDVILMTYTFSVDSDIPEGEHTFTIPPVPFSYLDEIFWKDGVCFFGLENENGGARTETKHVSGDCQFVFPDTTFSTTSMMIENVNISQSSVMVAEDFEISFSVYTSSDYVDARNTMDTFLQTVSINPFDIVETSKNEVVFASGARRIDYRLTAVFYGIPGVYLIPTIQVGTNSIKVSEPINVVSHNATWTVPKSKQEYDELKEVLGELTLPVRSISYSTEYFWWYQGARALGLVILLFLLVKLGQVLFKGSQGKRRRGEYRSRVAQTKSKYEHCKTAYVENNTREKLVELYYALRHYVLTVGRVENAYDGQHAQSLIKNNDLQASVSEVLLNELCELELEYTNEGMKRGVNHV